ncbi:MAG: TatD family hydrolase [Candidatus Omnitrophota bacterium]|nr:TatD family hydrolase [Candidatus Omnitrophota bacterium]MDZ4243049.1 TatD family hydrolase [Candidatus Omnitrophota bacterium]
MIIDTHAHMDQVPDAPSALEESARAGVEAVVAVGVDLASNKANLELKKTVAAPKIFVGLGIHPGNIKAEEVEDTLTFIRGHLSEAHAIGEIGLDFWYKWVRKDQDKKDEQRRVFRRQLDLAAECGLPAVVHSRGTWQECLDTVRESGVKKAVFHWYSGPVDVLEKILAAGYLVSCSPSLAYSPQSREAIAHAPIEQTMIETDSPVFYRFSADGDDGFQATPKDVFRTLEAYCELKKVDRDRALEILNRNARSFFGMEPHGT